MKPAVFYNMLNVKTGWQVKLKRQMLVLALLLLTGCSGITPSQHYNHREEGPPGGALFRPRRRLDHRRRRQPGTIA